MILTYDSDNKKGQKSNNCLVTYKDAIQCTICNIIVFSYHRGTACFPRTPNKSGLSCLKGGWHNPLHDILLGSGESGMYWENKKP